MPEGYIKKSLCTGGNILSVKKNGTAIQSYSYGDSEWKDLLTNYNGTNITYDTIGNPFNWRNNMSFTWSNGRRLTNVTKGTNNYSYTYDADGLRTSKTVNGVTTTYTYAEGLLLALETSDGKKMRFLYDGASSPYAMLFNGTMYYYEYNLQGDVVGILDSSKTRVAGYAYNAWGEIISTFGSDYSLFGALNPFRYRGYVYDEETGFYYLKSRYYDPEMCRFINADGQISGVGNDIHGYNMFAYCFNNPVNMMDENGNWPKWVKKAANMVKDFLGMGVKIAKTVIAPTLGFEFSAGVGHGMRGSFEVYGSDITVGKKFDELSVKLDYNSLDVGREVLGGYNIGLENTNISFGQTIGHFESYVDGSVTEYTSEPQFSIDVVSAEIYVAVGFSFSVEYNLETVSEYVYKIWE